ncbi:MAG: sugar ABC transporter permease [Lachnospiraceae bacterium]|nr:sugar ABC transporter permease [Lachnospiraceae bacterium]
MKKLTTAEYSTLNIVQKLLYNIWRFLCAIPTTAISIGKGAWNGIAGFFKGLGFEVVDTINTFRKGDWKTRVSFFIMGFGNISRGQILRGIMLLLFQIGYVVYMILPDLDGLPGGFSGGLYRLKKFTTLGDVVPGEQYDPILDTYIRVDGDNSFDILLYGILTILLCFVFVFLWRVNVKQNKIAQELLAKGKKLPKAKDDIKNLLDGQFHKTLLSLPLIGITCFTVLPIIFMIFVAFTNYGGKYDGYSNLFTWVGLDNFKELFNMGGSDSNLANAFGRILGWTMVWAVLATFTNYFLGILVAMLINKKGVKLKKLWRGILVLTIAIPQFVSLLYVSKLFAANGLVNSFLMNMGWTDAAIDFWGTPEIGRVLVVIINIWIGIPYLMLMATGILMNIPADMYESAKIDGASGFQQFTKITLPYMMFVTGPYLLTSFIGNINNFNVMFLLTGGSIPNPELSTSGGSATDYDLLITWIYSMVTGVTSNYKLSAVIAIMIFVVVATLSVIVYNVMPSTRNEEDFQ